MTLQLRSVLVHLICPLLHDLFSSGCPFTFNSMSINAVYVVFKLACFPT